MPGQIAVEVVYAGECFCKHLLVTSVLYAGFVVLAAASLRMLTSSGQR